VAGAKVGAEAASCESEAGAVPVTPTGEVDAADGTVDADAAGCESEADSVPVTPAGAAAAVSGAMLDADAGTCAVAP